MSIDFRSYPYLASDDEQIDPTTTSTTATTTTIDTPTDTTTSTSSNTSSDLSFARSSPSTGYTATVDTVSGTNNSDTGGGLSTGAIVAIGVTVIVIVFILLSAVTLGAVTRRRKQIIKGPSKEVCLYKKRVNELCTMIIKHVIK